LDTKGAFFHGTLHSGSVSEAPVSGMHPTYWKKYDENISSWEKIDTVIKWFGYPEEKRPAAIPDYFGGNMDNKELVDYRREEDAVNGGI
jgi:hypothetical protein